MKHAIHGGLQAIRSAGETPALQLPDPARAMSAR
jgi:hypothetical protein